MALQSAAALSTVIQSAVDSTPQGRARPAPHSRTAAPMGCVAGRTVCYFQSSRCAAWLPSVLPVAAIKSLWYAPSLGIALPTLCSVDGTKGPYFSCVASIQIITQLLCYHYAWRVGRTSYLFFLQSDATGVESPDLLLPSNWGGNITALMSSS